MKYGLVSHEVSPVHTEWLMIEFIRFLLEPWTHGDASGLGCTAFFCWPHIISITLRTRMSFGGVTTSGSWNGCILLWWMCLRISTGIVHDSGVGAICEALVRSCLEGMPPQA
jgi:hypothetical protein